MIEREIDVCFSGSGVRFPVFVGALLALEHASISVRRLVGNSGGSLVGGLYKSGMTPAEIEQVVLTTDFTRFASAGFFKKIKIFTRGYMNDGAEFEKFLLTLTKGKKLQDAKDFWAVATDLCAGETVILHDSEYPQLTIARAIRASASEPIVWNGVDVQGRLLYDGGVRYNFALDFFRPEPSGIPVVGVKLKSSFCTVSKNPGFSEILDATISNLVDAIDRKHIEDAIYARYVEVDCGTVQSTDFDLSREKKADLINRGYETVRKALPSLVP